MEPFVNWPPIEPDDQTCRKRMRDLQDILSEGWPATQKFRRILHLMETYEDQDWTAWCTKRKDLEAASLLQGLPTAPERAPSVLTAAPQSVRRPSGLDASCMTPPPLFSHGSHDKVALPLAASGSDLSPRDALIEANRQKAIATRAQMQAALHEKYRRELEVMGRPTVAGLRYVASVMLCA